jgi:hypothetical protein
MYKEIDFMDRIKILIKGSTYIGHYKNDGWKGSLPFYRFKCNKHGIVENYAKGYSKRLVCPLCIKENNKKIHRSQKQINDGLLLISKRHPTF